MEDYSSFDRNQLIARIVELSTLQDALLLEKNNLELLNFPWAGNLGNWYWQITNNRVICNEQKLLALGYTKAEAPETFDFNFFTEKLHPEDYQRVMDNMRNHLYGQSPAYETSYRICTRNNTWIWFYDRGKVVKRGPTGRPEMVAGIVFDITEQKRIEQLLETQNKQLLELSSIDPLTNIYNRRVLFEKLDYEMRRSARNKKPVSLLILDIDHFKKVNDTHGHLVGDKVLTQSAHIIRKRLRNTDIFGRYGGEEFIVIFPECNQAEGKMVAEEIRAAFAEANFEQSIQVTVSGGLVEFSRQSADELIDAADQCLYAAKRNGRNRIEVPETR